MGQTRHNQRIAAISGGPYELSRLTLLIPIKPSFHPVILVSQKATINRPKSSNLDLDSIIKLDQFFSWYNKKVDESKAGDAIGIFKLRRRPAFGQAFYL
jgi:hypothetical protein